MDSHRRRPSGAWGTHGGRGDPRQAGGPARTGRPGRGGAARPWLDELGLCGPVGREGGWFPGGYPSLGAALDMWVSDPYMWVRRPSILALLPGVRSGTPDLDRLTRFACLVWSPALLGRLLRSGQPHRSCYLSSGLVLTGGVRRG